LTNIILVVRSRPNKSVNIDHYNCDISAQENMDLWISACHLGQSMKPLQQSQPPLAAASSPSIVDFNRDKEAECC
jgi:hypothetical protein